MSNTPGQPPRGDAALRQAIATGSPVATNGKQEAELTAIERWQVGDDKGFNANCIYDHTGTGIAQVYGVPMHTRVEDAAKLIRFAAGLRNAHLIAASPSLHAYAKAEELRHQWIRSQLGAAGKVAMEAYDAYLVTMGWDSVQPRPDFLATYRASALAKAGGAK